MTRSNKHEWRPSCLPRIRAEDTKLYFYKLKTGLSTSSFLPLPISKCQFCNSIGFAGQLSIGFNRWYGIKTVTTAMNDQKHCGFFNSLQNGVHGRRKTSVLFDLNQQSFRGCQEFLLFSKKKRIKTENMDPYWKCSCCKYVLEYNFFFFFCNTVAENLEHFNQCLSRLKPRVHFYLIFIVQAYLTFTGFSVLMLVLGGF